MEALNLTHLSANVNNIQGLSDRPNTADGITAQQLKELFDKAGSDIKLFLNGTLIEETETYVNNVLKTAIETLQSAGYITSSDTRLTDSRRCNNTFDNYLTSRTNLHIGYGTSLPESGTDGDIFLLYS